MKCFSLIVFLCCFLVSTIFLFRFDKDLRFESYIKIKFFIESLKVEMKRNQEFIY
jgi:hypothetical protein